MLDARERLFKLNLSDYPNMKADNRSKLHKSIKDRAYPLEYREVTNMGDLTRKLNNVG